MKKHHEIRRSAQPDQRRKGEKKELKTETTLKGKISINRWFKAVKTTTSKHRSIKGIPQLHTGNDERTRELTNTTTCIGTNACWWRASIRRVASSNWHKYTSGRKIPNCKRCIFSKIGCLINYIIYIIV